MRKSYELPNKKTEIMNTIGKGTLIWVLAIRSLHNALIEDGFDKLENNFFQNQKSSKRKGCQVSLLKGDLEGCNFKNIKLDTSSLD